MQILINRSQGITRNEGKCGVCGDPYDGPRVHETGNSMALNVTARNFFPGSSIEILIEVVANHGGTFEFEMCWRDNATVRETEECFEPLKLNTPVNPLPSPASKSQSNHVHKPSEKLLQPNEEELERAAEDDLRDEYEFVLDPDAGTGLYAMSVMLPVERTCDHCVLRWHWRSANNWGVCDDGSEAIGCGYQEVYRNCADVSVSRNGAGIGLGLQRRRRRRRRR